jgi:hypothetical protein
MIQVNMKTFFHICCILSIAIIASCDLRSETAKKDMEKYTSSPTPPIPTPTTTIPIAPEDVVEVDSTQEGERIFISGHDQKKTANCTKFNRLMVNGDTNVVIIKGACRQIMVNGDKNEVTADASAEFVFNGTGNVVKYSRYPNGKQPTVVENQKGNIIEKISAAPINEPRKPKKP